MKNDLAQRMAELVTVPEKSNSKIRVIPQGFPTSTLISFFTYRKMFAELNKIALENGLIFSTYVDDVTFSTDNEEFDFNLILEEIEKQSPLRRLTDPSEVGDVALFLMSELSRGVTGEIIHVDSGFNILGGSYFLAYILNRFSD